MIPLEVIDEEAKLIAMWGMAAFRSFGGCGARRWSALLAHLFVSVSLRARLGVRTELGNRVAGPAILAEEAAAGLVRDVRDRRHRPGGGAIAIPFPPGSG